MLITLSINGDQELLVERDADTSYETARRLVLKFGLSTAANFSRTLLRPSDHWHLDEILTLIRGDRYWLWRAVDNEGEVLEVPAQRRRHAKVARNLLAKLPKQYGIVPTRIETDRLRAYPAASRTHRRRCFLGSLPKSDLATQPHSSTDCHIIEIQLVYH